MSAHEGSASSECTVESSRDSPLPSTHDDDEGDEVAPRRYIISLLFFNVHQLILK